MSSLSLEVKLVYVPILYDVDGKFVREGSDCLTIEEAESEAVDMVRDYVGTNDKWCGCRIERMAVPIYK